MAGQEPNWVLSRFAADRFVAVDQRARNPLVDDFRQVNPAVFALASREAPAPTLFNGGDLPPYTTSGNPPTALMRLPWQLRQAAAKADQAEWARLQNEYGHPGDNDVWLIYEPGAADPANAAYEARVRDWASGRPSAA